MGFLEHELAKHAHGQVYGGSNHASVTHELLAGAAGFEAMRMYEHHREREGFTPHHELAKELLAGFVAAEVDKHFAAAGALPLRSAVLPVILLPGSAGVSAVL